MKKQLVGLIAALAIAVPVHAQQAPVPDPAAQAVVTQLLESMGWQESVSKAAERLTQNLVEQVRAYHKTHIDTELKLSGQARLAAFERSEDRISSVYRVVYDFENDPAWKAEIVAGLVQMYARTYTVDEMRQLTAFYQTPVGRKMLTNLRQLDRETVELGKQVMESRVQKLMQAVEQIKIQPLTPN